MHYLRHMSVSRALYHDQENRKFILPLEEGEAFITYREREGVLHLVYSEVPPEQRGGGIGRELVSKTMEYMKERGWKAVPVCGYIRMVATRNPEWAQVLV